MPIEGFTDRGALFYNKNEGELDQFEYYLKGAFAERMKFETGLDKDVTATTNWVKNNRHGFLLLYLISEQQRNTAMGDEVTQREKWCDKLLEKALKEPMFH